MHWLQARASAVRYRVGGLPPSIRYFRKLRQPSPRLILRHVEARRYWQPASIADVVDLALAVVVAPFFVVGAAVWHSARSGRIHAARMGRHPLRQFLDQLRIYLSSGIMPATYYIFDLVERPTNAHARSFLKRAETKGLIYPIVRQHMPPRSSLQDKQSFEQRCTANGLPVIPTVAVMQNGRLRDGGRLPEDDLFIKPLTGKGGRGAERWRWEQDRYVSGDGLRLTPAAFAERLHAKSDEGGLIIQRCVRNHSSLDGLNCGSLATVRILTCQNRCGEAEIIGAAIRMAADPSSVVDNLHRGGLTAAVDLETGELGAATNLGKDARLGWVTNHPVSDAAIAGHRLVGWDELKALALRAQQVFADRLFVGWDLAMTPHGPVIVEGNAAPGLDILQRSTQRGMADGRFAEILADRMIAWGEYRAKAA